MLMFPIITSFEEMLFYLGRYDFLIPPEELGLTPHFADEAGDAHLSSEPLSRDTHA